jgi:hyaluronan synthase
VLSVSRPVAVLPIRSSLVVLQPGSPLAVLPVTNLPLPVLPPPNPVALFSGPPSGLPSPIPEAVFPLANRLAPCPPLTIPFSGAPSLPVELPPSRLEEEPEPLPREAEPSRAEMIDSAALPVALPFEESRVSWRQLMLEPISPIVSRTLARFSALLVFAACTLNIFFLRWENFGYYWYRPFLNAYSIGVATFILSRFLIGLFYRPPRDRGLEPTVSIVITALNEEEAIFRTIACCYQVDYPRRKLEVVVVDDGSTDRTGAEIARAKARWPDLLVEAFEHNRGKREAMAAGARIASGEILIYVDSDSFLRDDAVRKIAQGFADPFVAAVAGHTDVANPKENMLTRMQEVRYYVAFRVLKAAESVFGAVTCCPGCFSAYRRSCILEVLDRWLDQRFLGVRATFGDDRALTNLLLRHHKILYSSEAVAATIVPDRHRKFLRQQVRWKKSWLRECLIAATFMWKKHPIAALGFYAQLVFPILAPILLLRAFLWLPLVSGDPLSMVLYAYGVMLIGLTFSSSYLFWRTHGDWIYGVYFTVYYMFVLVWQMPYAIVTSRDNRWGTR